MHNTSESMLLTDLRDLNLAEKLLSREQILYKSDIDLCLTLCGVPSSLKAHVE